MNEKINITKMDGTNVTADIICFIENTKTNKRYVYYTLNETVGTGPNSTVKIYVSKIKQDNPNLDTPISEDEWNVLKGYMGDSLKGIVNTEVKYIPLSELTTPVSVSDRAIAMPTSYDYINKQRGTYAQNVAIVEPTTTAESIVEAAPTEPTEPVTETPSVPEVPEGPTEPTPVVETPVAPEPVPSVEPTPVVPPVEEPNLAQVTPTEETSSVEDSSNDAIKLEPIDLATIEAKYAEMIDEINKLKEKELEAAKRYNATIELSAMHSEQHANYVQNDLKESLAAQEMANANQEPATPSVTMDTPIVPETSQEPVIPVQEPIPTIEPAPVTPIVPEPSPAIAPQELETNWFDMPNNQ